MNEVTTLFETKFVNTDLLSVEYREWNPSGNRTVVLVHGWPDSVRWRHTVFIG